MTIGPRRVLTRRSPRAVEKTRLSQEHEGTVGVFSISDCLFGRGNLLEASAQMHRRRPQAFGSFPGDRRVQCVIHFEDTRPVTKFSKLPLVTVRQSFPSNQCKLPRCQVTEKQVIFQS